MSKIYVTSHTLASLAIVSGNSGISLSAEGLSVSVRDITAWSICIDGNPVELNIPNNNITPEGAKTLAKLVINESLRFLNLSRNNIVDSGALVFSDEI